MQLSVFSTDSQKSGFRLQFMEVLNWGTFDEKVYSIRPLGESSLLTGANGSGKTTFVDALLTLIVPEKRYRFYNQSSGSEKKGDRTEDSYVLGGFGMLNNEHTGSSKTEYLREDKDKAYSILLAHFSNEANQFITLFQVRYYSNGEMKKVFGISHKALTIEADFKPFDLSGNWKRNIEQRYNKGNRKLVEWFDAASRYATRITEVFGMQSLQALQLFNQTVGIKVLGNLDEFIRTHMLEQRNMQEEFLELKKHLSTLLEAQRNIEKAEDQILLLSPVKDHYELYQKTAKDIEENAAGIEASIIWKSFTKHELITDAIKENEIQLEQVDNQLKKITADLNKLNDDQRTVINQIEGNKAGQRLKDIEKQITEATGRQRKAQSDLRAFQQWCEKLNLPSDEINDEQTYKRLRKENDRKKFSLDTEKRQNEDDEFESKNERKQAISDKETIELQLLSLQQNKSNIDWRLINLRKQICDTLNIDPVEVPFLGELVQVKHTEIDWQPAIEKLLHSYALRLLVPDKYYKKITRYVNQENLKTKLVYEHVSEIALVQIIENDTVPEKLEFNPDHSLSPWVQNEITRLFRYSCLPDEKNIERYDKAITLKGLIKNGRRHEKDDRPDYNDPGKYILGWNNENKKTALQKQRSVLVDLITKCDEVIARCLARTKRLDERYYASIRIFEHAGFDEIDVLSISKNIQKLKIQAEELRKGNEMLDLLSRQLKGIENDIEEIQKQFAAAAGQKAILEQSNKTFRDELIKLAPVVKDLTEADKETLLHFQHKHKDTFAVVDLNNIETAYSQFKSELERKQVTLREELQKQQRKIENQIAKIKNPAHQLLQKYPDWLGDVQHLPEDPQYGTEYLEWLEKLKNENLPKFKRDFENFINVTITHKIAGLKASLDRWEQDIKASVGKLNDSLKAINFNKLPDTYIQLGCRLLPTGTETKEFRQKLLEALPQAVSWQQESFEAKSLHFTERVQPLIDELDRNEAYRNKVLDVRNWFEFWAEEKYRNNGELKKTYRQMGQLSGGEKAQLTYTILCSAIAYQFGITREGKNSKSLRFITVDESFSNQDEEKATYLMELCKELHLQLLVVTPSDKIQIVQEFIAHVHLVQRINNRNSTLFNMTIKELKEKMEAVDNLN